MSGFVLIIKLIMFWRKVGVREKGSVGGCFCFLIRGREYGKGLVRRRYWYGGRFCLSLSF